LAYIQLENWKFILLPTLAYHWSNLRMMQFLNMTSPNKNLKQFNWQMGNSPYTVFK